jgi:serine/threonine protein kinase
MVIGAAGILYTLLDQEYFESLQNYKPSSELREIVELSCAPPWQIVTDGFWTRCTPPHYKFNLQGWKLHLSGTEYNAEELLRRVAPLLAKENVAFKFASDKRMTRLCTSKNWPRTGGGKFITLYPRDLEQFKRLAEACHQETKEFTSPYILSDRPYKDSRVVFYRYGGHRLVSRVDGHGFQTPVIAAPDGRLVSDERLPVYRVPDWAVDPFPAIATPASTPGPVKLNDRYLVTGAIRYSNAGGIYKGTDLKTGESVVIKEARPGIKYWGHGTDAVSLLQKEARILQKLSPTNLAPRFVDSFNEWEHCFLVEEFVEGETLWGYAIDSIFKLYSLGPSRLFEFFHDTIVKLTRGLQAIHGHGIVLRDFTKRNVLFTPQGDAKFIDYELAYELDRNDLPVAGSTEGYASPEQIANEIPSFKQDHYALGALVLDILAFTAGGLRLNRSGVLAGLQQVLMDFGLPGELLDVVKGLTELDPSLRWTPDQVLQAVEAMHVPATAVSNLLPPGTTPPSRPDPQPEFVGELQATIEGVTRYLENKIELEREDRLWPSSCEVFLTNPANLEYGATGVAALLQQVNGAVPDRVLEWILRHSTPDKCPPGLYVGLAGVAVFMLKLGETEQAIRLLQLADDPARTYELPGLYEGAAGWGLANLHFWEATKEEKYLAAALEAGERLVQAAVPAAEGVYWEAEGDIPLGLAWGGSGIALFLTYLHAALGSSQFIETAERALDYEMSQARWINDTVFFTDSSDAPLGAAKSPHTRYGTAGVGSAAIRLYAATGKKKFREIADVCAHTVSSRYTNKLWQDYGLAGFGEFLLDMHYFLGERLYLNNAFHLAGAILPYRIERPQGIAFAGTDMMRICCDWGGGAAGIGVFLHRLLHPENPRLMFLDKLLKTANAVPDEALQPELAP